MFKKLKYDNSESTENVSKNINYFEKRIQQKLTLIRALNKFKNQRGDQ